MNQDEIGKLEQALIRLRDLEGQAAADLVVLQAAQAGGDIKMVAEALSGNRKIAGIRNVGIGTAQEIVQKLTRYLQKDAAGVHVMPKPWEHQADDQMVCECRGRLRSIGQDTWACRRCGLIYMTERLKEQRRLVGLPSASTPSVGWDGKTWSILWPAQAQLK